MAKYSWNRQPNWSANADDFEILTATEVQDAIMARLGITVDTEYTDLLTSDKGIRGMNVSIIFNTPTRISINEEDYSLINPISNVAWETGDFVRDGIYSIRAEDNGSSGTVIVDII